MHFLPFFLGFGKLRYWYLSFYFLGIPLYLFGIFLLLKLPAHPLPQSREYVLTVFTFGYILLDIFSLINTLLYAQKTRQFFKALFLFLGIQILFWGIGATLENNYLLLCLYFFFFLLIAMYGNLFALFSLHTQHSKKKAQEKKVI